MSQAYTAVPQNPPGMLDQGVQKEDNCCYNTFCWIFQIAIWGFIGTIIAFLIIGIKNQQTFNGLLYGCGGVYLIYIILEFCSPTSKYLCNKSSDQGMYEKMGSHFRTPPEIQFHCECYHYEIRHRTRTDSEGRTEHYTTTERVVTYRETYSMPYYSERDVSGLFYLNCDAAYIQRKFYIKLELKEEINFADAISYMDYEFEKDKFWARNRFRDVHFDFNESRIIPGMRHHNLVKMGTNEPCSVNFFFFFLFTLLTCSEFYKSYVNSFCVYQKFKVRKLVSTRYDLNQQVYQVFVPQINLIVQQYQYQPNDYNYLNNNYQVNLPTQEELDRAQQYKDKVPDYQLSSGGGNIQAGVIVDNPSYSSFNPTQPPAQFAAVSGNVGLSPDQINANGGAPAGFGQPGFHFNIAPPEQQGQQSPQNYQPPAQAGYAPQIQQSPQNYQPPAQQGYPPQVQQSPQNYQPPTQQGYPPQVQQPGYIPPTQPGYP